MCKNRPSIALVLALLLSSMTAMALLAGRGAKPQAMGGSDSGLTVPPANMSMDAGWEVQPAAGQPVRLAWPNIRVNNDATNEAQNEPFVAVNPLNPKHIVVGANNWQVGDGHFEVFAYVSFDAGRSWAASQPYIDRNASRLNAADPTVAFGAGGAVYFAFVAMTPAQGAVAVSRSNDGGLTWVSQSWANSFTTGADKPAVVAGNNKLYLFYQNQSLNGLVSSDGGASWSSPSIIETGGRNAYPVVDAKGSVSVFYNTASSIKLARLAGSGSSYTITTVANATPLQPRQARYRANIYPAGGADAKGNLYVAWADGRNSGRGNDIMYSRSTNGGSAWSAPVALNTDAGSADQLMPSLAVGSDGSVSVAWLDSRNDTGNVNYDVYMSHSANGVRFGGETRVTNVSSNPNNDPRTQGGMIGDYFALGAGDGVVYSLWTDTRNNNEDIYMAPIPVSRSINH